MLANFREKVAEKFKALTLDPQEKDINDLVDKATVESLPVADWGINMELVDIINADPGPASDKTCKALRRVLQKPSVHAQMLTLTLLETVVKNTSGAFHHFFVRSELWQDLVSVGSYPRAFDPEVRDKILTLIEDFARGVPVPQYREAYEQLLDKGMDFPVRPESENVPYYTPPTRQPDHMAGVSDEDKAAIQEAMRQMESEAEAEEQRAVQQRQNNFAMAAPTFAMAAPYLPQNMPVAPAQQQQQAPARTPTPPTQRSPTPSTPEEVMQLGRNSCDLLQETLQHISPADPGPAKEVYVQELADSCSRARDKLEALLQSDASEALLDGALALHEELRAVLEKYDGLLAAAESLPLVPPRPAALSPSPPPNAAAFSLLGDDDNEAESPVLGSRRQQQPAGPTSLAPPAAGPAMADLISLDNSPVQQAQAGGIGAHDRSMSDQLDLTEFQDEIGGQQRKQ